MNELQSKLGNDFERLVIGKDFNILDYPREVARYTWASEYIKSGDLVIDIGCSSGYGLSLLPKDITYIGLDYDPDIIKFAINNFQDRNHIFIKEEIHEFLRKISSMNIKYDVIIAFEFLEHLVDGKEIAQKLKKHCKKLLCSVPYNEPLGNWSRPNHHKLHDLTEYEFKNFHFDYLTHDGRFTHNNKELVPQFLVGDVIKSEGIMLMEWNELMDSQGLVMDTTVSKDMIPPIKHDPTTLAKTSTKQETKNFLITSHTEGKYSEIKKKLLIDLVTNLKTFFPDCYIVVCSSSTVPTEVVNIVDKVHVDDITKDEPYGTGELALVCAGLDIMHQECKDWVYKFTYDTIIDASNKESIELWRLRAISDNKKFIGTAWVDKIGSPWDFPKNHDIIGTWMYYGKTSFLKRIFDNISIELSSDILEKLVTDRIMKSGSDGIFLFDSADQMLGGNWDTHGDLIQSGGTKLKHEVDIPVMVKSNKPRVLCYVCTKDRFFTTLPMTITSLMLQTRVPDHLIIYEDGEHKDLNSVGYYKYLFETLARKGCTVWMDYAAGKGQHFNDERANLEVGFDYVWRFDDDEVAEPDVLERMLKHFENDKKGDLGAVAGFVGGPLFGQVVSTGKLENIFSEDNFQWSQGTACKEVEHLHSSFLYKPGIAHFDLDLSPVSHRGETMFSVELRKKGLRLIADQSIKIWHYRNSEGGIRSAGNNNWMYDHDEKVFLKFLKALGYRMCVLNGGIGDHIAFMEVLPALQKRYPHLILSVCYPELFEDKLRDGDSMISIGQAPIPAREECNVYQKMIDWHWKGTIFDAYKEIYIKERDN